MFIRIFLFSVLFLVFNTLLFAQRQNNTIGSEIFADAPYRLNKLSASGIPVSVYIHDSECSGCSNDLAFIDISLKSASSTSFGPVLTYDTLSEPAFQSMFSQYSSTDAQWGSQSFSDAGAMKDAGHTMIFTADTNWWIPPVPVVTIDSRYFYFNFNIPEENWIAYAQDDVIDIKIVFGLDFATDQEVYLRVFLHDNDFPSISGWYRGDTHFHAINTQNSAENGLPLELSKTAAKFLGMDWITITDHSCDFDNYGVSMENNWQWLGQKVEQLNQDDSSLIFVRGMEASVTNSNGKVVHALVYPSETDPFTLPYLGDGGGDLSSTEVSISRLCDSLEVYNGFCYAAHPFAEGDELSVVINGSVWNLSDSLFPENGQIHPSVGSVICNDLSQESDIYSGNDSMVVRKSLVGGQIWNLWNTLSCTDTETDPWNVNCDGGITGFAPLNDTEYQNHSYRLRQNMDAYKQILQRGLRMKNQNSSVSDWQFYLSGGSDAHGSFNYATTDYFGGGINGDVNNNAIGRISTLAWCPDGMGNNGLNVLYALRHGHTVMSSGPVLTISVSSPSEAALPGDFINLTSEDLMNVWVNFQLATTPEFGNAATIRVIIGTESNEYSVDLPLFTSVYSLSLFDLLQQIFSGNIPENQNIYLRAELTTLKMYSFSESVFYKKSYEFFNCYTNPVWIKTGTINQVLSFQTEGIKVYPNPAGDYLTITFASLPDQLIIDVFSVEGKKQNVGIIKRGQSVLLDLKTFIPGLYFMRIGNEKVFSCYRFLKQ